jgi:protein-disulfide isomerase
MRDRLLNVATAVMVICAVLATGFTVSRSVSPTRTPAAAGGIVVPRSQPDWSEYARTGHVIGPRAAPIAIVEFADFQCPFCRTFKTFVDSLRRRHPDQVKLVYRHFPIRTHTLAVAAARASECAARQGRFDEMYETLYDEQASIGVQPWAWFASKAQIPDRSAFDRCVDLTDGIAALATDTVAGNRLGIEGTPTILINGIRLDGVPPLDSLEAYVSRASRTPQIGR